MGIVKMGDVLTAMKTKRGRQDGNFRYVPSENGEPSTTGDRYTIILYHSH